MVIAHAAQKSSVRVGVPVRFIEDRRKKEHKTKRDEDDGFVRVRVSVSNSSG